MAHNISPFPSIFNVKKCDINVDVSGAPGAELLLKDAALEVLRCSYSKSVGCGLVSTHRKGCCCHPLLKTEIAFIRIRDPPKKNNKKLVSYHSIHLLFEMLWRREMVHRSTYCRREADDD